MQLEFEAPVWFDQMGLMAWPLIVASVVAVAISLERFVFFIRQSHSLPVQVLKIEELLDHHKDLSKKLRDELASEVLSEERRKSLSGLGLLRLIGTIAPLLGLLGTVLGIIEAFRDISTHAGPVSPGLIADGLWEAMLTTAAGLFIALPVLIMAQMFRMLAEGRLDDICRRANVRSAAIEIETERAASRVASNDTKARAA